jgi:hypothetical protein
VLGEAAQRVEWRGRLTRMSTSPGAAAALAMLALLPRFLLALTGGTLENALHQDCRLIPGLARRFTPRS